MFNDIRKDYYGPPDSVITTANEESPVCAAVIDGYNKTGAVSSEASGEKPALTKYVVGKVK